MWIDLLKADIFRRDAESPEFLRQEIEAESGLAETPQVVVDETHKIPASLDERRTDDGIDILPATLLVRRLWKGNLGAADLYLKIESRPLA